MIVGYYISHLLFFGRGLFKVVLSAVGSQKGNMYAEVYKVMPFLLSTDGFYFFVNSDHGMLYLSCCSLAGVR